MDVLEMQLKKHITNQVVKKNSYNIKMIVIDYNPCFSN